MAIQDQFSSPGDVNPSGSPATGSTPLVSSRSNSELNDGTLAIAGRHGVLNHLDLLGDGDLTLRTAIASQLHRSPEAARVAVREIASALVFETDVEVKKLLLGALRNASPASAAHLGAVLTQLEHPNETVRQSALHCIRAMGSNAHHAVAPLFVFAANESLQYLAADARDLISTLSVDALARFDKFSAIMTKLGSREQLQGLRALLQASGPTTGDAVDYMVITMGTVDTDKVRLTTAMIFNELLKRGDAFACARAPIAVEYLIAQCEEEHKPVKIKLIEALGVLAEAKSAPAHLKHVVPTMLRELSRFEEGEVRSWIGYLAYLVDHDSINQTMPVFQELLNSDERQSRSGALSYLGQLVKTLPAARVQDTVRRISRSVHDEEEAVRFAAIEALGCAGHDSEFAVTVLGTVLADECRPINERVAACEALEELQPHLSRGQRDRAVSLLAYALNESEVELARKAAQVLRHFGDELGSALGLVRRLFEKESAEVLDAAITPLSETFSTARLTPMERNELAHTLHSTAVRIATLNEKRWNGLVQRLREAADLLSPRQ